MSERASTGGQTQTTASAAFNMLVELRGGLPEACDFCRQPYTEHRWPVPEEASEWACNECEARWRKQDAARSASGE